jgi:aspartokinase/homoserine dehydrogenase 1
MQVLKFGGTSVADATAISGVTRIVKGSIEKDRTIVVLSAIGGCTDTLIETGKLASEQERNYINILDNLEKRHLKIVSELIPGEYGISAKLEVLSLFDQLRDICRGVWYIRELSDSTLDLIMSFGEILSTRIFSIKLISDGVANFWADSRELIRTRKVNSCNTVDSALTYSLIANLINTKDDRLFIVPGFIASDCSDKNLHEATLIPPGRTTTLGRGGSDYTASVFAAATTAEILQIWSDVNGMMTADPRVVPEARTIRHISYKEAQELSHFGAKVIYPPTIQPVVDKCIPIEVRNTFEPEDPGTVIEMYPPETAGKIRGISRSNKIALLSMEGSGMVGIPGYSSRLFGALANARINIILITQASSVHTMCVAVDEKDAEKAREYTDETFAYEISLSKVEPLKVERNFSILSLVGDDMKNQSGTGGRMFNALGRAGINIRAIAQGSSEKNISVVVSTEDSDIAIKMIHEEFFTVQAK